MPAIILRFERRDPVHTPRLPPPFTVFRPRSAPTSRQIAHRWAMLSHLSRHSVSWRRVAARRGGQVDPLP